MWFTAPDLVANGQPTDNKSNIGYATSTDGINWSVYPEAVIIAGSQENWDAAAAAEPSVLKIGSTYHMWYSALDNWAIENFAVGYAYSLDGINWTKDITNPVLDVGLPATWDAYWASHPTVIFDSTDNLFKMLYTGRDIDDAALGNVTSLSDYTWDIGYAFSFNTVNVTNNALGSSDVIAFPNPTHGPINILTEESTYDIYITVFTISGEEVLTVENKTKMDISSLKTGFYILKIEMAGTTHVRKIVKIE